MDLRLTALLCLAQVEEALTGAEVAEEKKPTIIARQHRRQLRQQCQVLAIQVDRQRALQRRTLDSPRRNHRQRRRRSRRTQSRRLSQNGSTARSTISSLSMIQSELSEIHRPLRRGLTLACVPRHLCCRGRNYAEIFLQLPPPDQYPDYYQLIQRPVSFQLVRVRPFSFPHLKLDANTKPAIPA